VPGQFAVGVIVLAIPSIEVGSGVGLHVNRDGCFLFFAALLGGGEGDFLSAGVERDGHVVGAGFGNGGFVVAILAAVGSTPTVVLANFEANGAGGKATPVAVHS